MKKILVAFMAIGLLSMGALAQTTQINPGDITNPTATIDFNNLSNGTFITNQYASAGVTFSNAWADVGDSSRINGSTVASNFDPNVGCAACTPMTITFSTAATQIGLYIVTNPGTTIAVNTAHDGTFSFTYNTSTSGSVFIGLQDFSGITSLTLDASNTLNGAMVIDDLEITDTPEPGSLFLLGSGLLGGIASVRRKLIG